MVSIEKSFCLNNLTSSQANLKRKYRTKNRTFSTKTTLLAKKIDLSGIQQLPTFKLRVQTPLLARSVLAIFGLGFIDAGYSGDWSRIGVISKESEDLLKLAALIVIPLCLILIFSISRVEDNP